MCQTNGGSSAREIFDRGLQAVVNKRQIYVRDLTIEGKQVICLSVSLLVVGNASIMSVCPHSLQMKKCTPKYVWVLGNKYFLEQTYKSIHEVHTKDSIT